MAVAKPVCHSNGGGKGRCAIRLAAARGRCVSSNGGGRAYEGLELRRRRLSDASHHAVLLLLLLLLVLKDASSHLLVQ
jgi:hypothetical protein